MEDIVRFRSTLNELPGDSRLSIGPVNVNFKKTIVDHRIYFDVAEFKRQPVSVGLVVFHHHWKKELSVDVKFNPRDSFLQPTTVWL